jgi:hypothetical protein
MLFQDAAHPNVGGRLKISAADPLADQVLGRADAGIYVDEDEAVAETAMQEHRDRGERLAAVALHIVAADIGFADIEFVLARHAPMPLARAHVGQHDKVDAVRRHRAIAQCARNLIIAAGHGQFQLRHFSRSPSASG